MDLDFELINDLYQWLNRKSYYIFQPIYEDSSIPAVYYNGTFNLTLEQAGSRTVGIDLDFTADAPYGYLDVSKSGNTTSSTGLTIIDPSNEYGAIYCDMDITVNKAGTLIIANSNDGANTIIKNCTKGEVIHFYGQLKQIESASHLSIASDFNYRFPRIINTESGNTNTFTTSLSCAVSIKYKAIKKVALL
jgi:hypothetical protein